MVTSRQRVLFVVLSSGGGGAERFFSNLLPALDRNFFDIHLQLLNASGPFMQDVPADVEVHDLRVSRVRYAIPAVLRLLWRLRPDTVLSTLGHLNLALTMCKPFMPRKVRLIVRPAWSTMSRMEKVQHPNRWNWAYRHFYRKADLIVCQSDFMLNELREHLGLASKKLVRIYNPIDLQSLWELGHIGNSPYLGAGPHIVTAGRLSWEKGYDVLLDAMPQVISALPAAQLHILGEGPRRLELLQQSQRLGLTNVVHFLGFHQNPWRYFRHADLFVLSSRNDALPNALLEAFALGTPVVATDCPGSIREIQHCNETMILVPSEDPSELSKGILSGLQPRRPRTELAEARRRLHRFDLQQIAREYARILISNSDFK